MSKNYFQALNLQRLRALKGVVTLCAVLTATGFLTQANAASLSLFDTGGTTLNLTMFVDDTTQSLLGGSLTGLAGILVSDPLIPNGIVVSDFGLTTFPSTLVFGLDAATLTQGVSFFADVFNFSVGGPGILIPVTAFPQTSITDPALLTLLSGPITFGFAFTGTSDDQSVTSVNYTLASVTVGAPEPATWPLVIFGIAAVGAGRLRLRRRLSPR